MSFWKKIFGGEKLPAHEPASTQPSDGRGQQPVSIHDVVESGDLEKVKTLIKHNKNLVNRGDSAGHTPLHGASSRGQMDMTKLLIANGANVNAQSWRGATPLQFAAGDGRKEIVELLLANNADVNLEAKSGETALHNAAYDGHIEVVKLLLANGANVNGKTPNCETPLGMA